MAAEAEPTDERAAFADLIRDEREYPRRRDRVPPEGRRARRRRALIASLVTVAIVLAAVGGYAGWASGPRTTTAERRIDGDIGPPTAWWRLTHPGERGG